MNRWIVLMFIAFGFSQVLAYEDDPGSRRIAECIEKYTFNEIAARAAVGEALFQVTMGYGFQIGQWGTVDVEAAYKWFLRAANAGDVLGMAYLAMAYDNGYGCKQDHQLAFTWWEKAAKGGDALAEMVLARRYDGGELGVRKDTAAALQWYEAAAKQGNVRAMKRAAQLLFLEENSTSKKNALDLLNKAALDDYEARTWLVRLYGTGKFVQKDPKEAYFWVLILRGTEKKPYLEDAKLLEEEFSIDEKAFLIQRAEQWLSSYEERHKVR